ncbi:hypothetical protein FOA20_00050 [Peribacillus simplex]
MEAVNRVDAIISRGGTAKLIKQSINIPVIDMHLSGYDADHSEFKGHPFDDSYGAG